MIGRVRLGALAVAVVLSAVLGWHFGGLQGTLAVVAGAAASYGAWHEHVAALYRYLGEVEATADGRLRVQLGDRSYVDVDTRSLRDLAVLNGGSLDLTGWTDDAGQRHQLEVRDGEGRPVRLTFEIPDGDEGAA